MSRSDQEIAESDAVPWEVVVGGDLNCQNGNCHFVWARTPLVSRRLVRFVLHEQGPGRTTDHISPPPCVFQRNPDVRIYVLRQKVPVNPGLQLVHMLLAPRTPPLKQTTERKAVRSQARGLCHQPKHYKLSRKRATAPKPSARTNKQTQEWISVGAYRFRCLPRAPCPLTQ